MEDFKPLLTSKTFWGGAVSVVAGAAGLVGYTIGLEDQVALTNLLFAGASVVGGLVAIVGRAVASKKIG